MLIIDLPGELLVKSLLHVSVATLIRLTTTCRNLREAAMEEAWARCDLVWGGLDGLADDALPHERIGEQPLAALFKSELQDMMRCIPGDWLHNPSFLYFRCTEDDVIGAVDNEEAMLVYNGSRLEWLHHVEAYDCFDGEDVSDWLGVRADETLWLESDDTYLALTRHLAMHPSFGRPTVSMQALLASNGATQDLRVLREWVAASSGEEKMWFDIDMAAGVDAAIMLSRFARPSPAELDPALDWCHSNPDQVAPYLRSLPRMHYRGDGMRRFDRCAIERLVSRVVPKWQRRASGMGSSFFRDIFEGVTAFQSTGRRLPLYRHRALSDWFRCSLSFFDAIEQAKKEYTLARSWR